MSETIRPTRKQHELLNFIEKFIASRGYSPSYREIKMGLNYNSVATVALHVDNLIKRGHLQKRDYSARSLELVKPSQSSALKTNQIKPGEEKWLIDKVDYYFSKLEQSSVVETALLDELYVLIGCLKILGLSGAVQSFLPRLNDLKQKAQTA